MSLADRINKRKTTTTTAKSKPVAKLLVEFDNQYLAERAIWEESSSNDSLQREINEHLLSDPEGLVKMLMESGLISMRVIDTQRPDSGKSLSDYFK